MKKILSLLLLLQSICFYSYGQGHGFKFGQFSYTELEMKDYPLDSSAAAVVLNEFGEAYFDSEETYNLMFEYHVKIKILKVEGLQEADFKILLYKHGADEQGLNSVEASTFTLVNGSAVETKFDRNKILNDKVTKNWTSKKIALSNVQVGSVIEIAYRIESPFEFEFRPWKFQSHLPKMKSEYWAFIPANYVYNITSRGFYPLSLNKSELIYNCWTPGGNVSDCVHYMWAMQNIPAFIEEDYMTSPSNFISAINFQLAEYKDFAGRIRKFTQEWKDVENLLRGHEKFGAQLRRAKDVVKADVESLVSNEADPLAKAKKIYDFIKGWYVWDGDETILTDGVRKAFENKKGNVADINLSLVAALRYAGLDADPMILSTRDNGLPVDLHPVVTDFDYVIAKVNIGDKVYLLDATEDAYPFGILPIRCLNGKGRVMDDENESYWYEIKPGEKNKEITMLDLKLNENGTLTGSINKTYIGYAAIQKRQEIKSFTSQQEYITDFDNKWSRGSIQGFTIDNLDEIGKPINEKLEVEIEWVDDMKAPSVFFNAFIMDKLERNPFKSKERLYPVDYGVSQDDVMVLTLELPPTLEITELPAKLGLALPNAGGRFIYDVQVNGNKITVNNSFSIAKPIFSRAEYHFLKELYDRILQVQNADLVLKQKAK